MGVEGGSGLFAAHEDGNENGFLPASGPARKSRRATQGGEAA